MRPKGAALTAAPDGASAASSAPSETPEHSRVLDAAEALILLSKIGFEIRRVEFGGAGPVIWVAPSRACDLLDGVPCRRKGGRTVRAAPFPASSVRIQWEELH